MPILFEGTRATEPQMAAMIQDHLGGLRAITEQVAKAPPDRLRDPLGAETIRELAEQVDVLSRLAQAPGASPELQRIAVNVSYAAMIASIDLYKSLLGLPKVPGSKRPAAPAP
jgi:hypothetical protein